MKYGVGLDPPVIKSSVGEVFRSSGKNTVAEVCDGVCQAIFSS